MELIEPENIDSVLELFNKTSGFVTAILVSDGNVLANQSPGCEKFYTYCDTSKLNAKK